ncbi:MAG: GTP-binding protein, partial [Clostridia bacterium]|nr:GTP-binding protein [Clostridia bacterium]
HDHDHHHEHGEECHCHEHHHEHGECCCHGHHHAEDVFESVAIETPKSYTEQELNEILTKLCSDNYGIVLRAKGIVKSSESELWHYFDLVAGEFEIRSGAPDVTGKICVIGSQIDKQKIKNLF